MTSLADTEFDHDAAFVKRREYGHGVTYTQRGVVFSSGYEPIKRVDTPDPKKETTNPKANADKTDIKKKVKPKKPSAKKSAADKLSEYSGGDKPDAVQTALAEDKATLEAEKNVA